MYGIATAMQEFSRQHAEAKATKAFMESIKDFPVEVKSKMIADRVAAKRRIEEESTKERRHQEIVDAIKNSGSKSSGIAALVFGSCLIGSMMDGDK